MGKCAKPIAGVLPHPIINTRDQVITEGQTYDLLLRAGGNRTELRVHVSNLRPQEFCLQNTELGLRFRKGQLPDWLHENEDLDGYYFRIFLYPDGTNSLTAQFSAAYPKVDRKKLVIKILPAGTLSLLH